MKWSIENERELRGKRKPGFFEALISFVWFQSGLYTPKRNRIRGFYRLATSPKRHFILFCCEWERISHMYDWVNQMPNKLYRELESARIHLPFADWWNYARIRNVKLPELKELLTIARISPYRFANKLARRERRNQIQLDWDTRKLSRATVKATGQARAVRL